MRLGVGLVLLTAAIACGRAGSLFQQYEYEEHTYLSLDGAATVYVNSSLHALDALRGAAFDLRPNARVDRAAIREYFTSPVTRVGPVNLSRRGNRRFVHVRIDVDDIQRLSEAPHFAWSTYELHRVADQIVYRQTIGAAAAADPENGTASRSTGEELVRFRLHLPSKIEYHNAGSGNHKRGNILVWEQRLADRLHGQPITIEARMQTQSILYRTLWLFGATVIAVGMTFGAVIWWIVRRGANPGSGLQASGSRGITEASEPVKKSL
jgi:hypothetical protein